MTLDAPVRRSDAISESSDASEHRRTDFGGDAPAVGTGAALEALTAGGDTSSSSSDAASSSRSGARASKATAGLRTRRRPFFACVGSAPPDAFVLTARIVATSNQLEEEPWLPVRNIVTMFRIQVSAGEKRWEVLRRYSDFSELHLRLSRALDPALLPPMPPKLLLNEDAAIAERYLELDAYLRKLLAIPATSKHGRLMDFLGAEKHGVRYGVRRYEYDSAQSEGNKYIRDDQL